jgi:hypothetical protein
MKGIVNFRFGLTSEISKPKDENRCPVEQNGIGEWSERVCISHLVVVFPQISKGIGTVIKPAVAAIGAIRTPELFIVATVRGVVGTRYALVHFTTALVGVDVARETDANWWSRVLFVFDLEKKVDNVQEMLSWHMKMTKP